MANLLVASASAAGAEGLRRPVRGQVRARWLNVIQLAMHQPVTVTVSFNRIFASKTPRLLSRRLSLDLELSALALRRHLLIVHGVEDQFG